MSASQEELLDAWVAFHKQALMQAVRGIFM
jgi:hypothetical protein